MSRFPISRTTFTGIVLETFTCPCTCMSPRIPGTVTHTARPISLATILARTRTKTVNVASGIQIHASVTQVWILGTFCQPVYDTTFSPTPSFSPWTCPKPTISTLWPFGTWRGLVTSSTWPSLLSPISAGHTRLTKEGNIIPFYPLPWTIWEIRTGMSETPTYVITSLSLHRLLKNSV